MYFVIIGMLLTLVLAAVVLALVAVPARRQGRVVLSAQGEEMIHLARERTSEAVDAAKDRVGGLTDRLPRTHRDGTHGRVAAADPVIDLREPRLPAHPPLQ